MKRSDFLVSLAALPLLGFLKADKKDPFTGPPIRAGSGEGAHVFNIAKLRLAEIALIRADILARYPDCHITEWWENKPNDRTHNLKGVTINKPHIFCATYQMYDGPPEGALVLENWKLFQRMSKHQVFNPRSL